MLHFTGWVILPQEHSGVKDDDILFSDSVFASSPHRRHNFQTGAQFVCHVSRERAKDEVIVLEV